MRRIHLARTMAVLAAVSVIPAAAAAQQQQGDRAAHHFLSAVDAGEIQQGMLAQQRAMEPAVRMFAVAMAAEHSSALITREARMEQLGTGLGLGQGAWTAANARWTQGPGMNHGQQGGHGMNHGQGMQGQQGGMSHGQGTQGQGSQGQGNQSAMSQGAQGQQGNQGGMSQGQGSQGQGSQGQGNQSGMSQGSQGQQGGQGQGQGNQSATGNQSQGQGQGMAHGQGGMVHNAMAMNGGNGWAGATIQYQGVLTPAGMRELHDDLMEHPASRPVAEAGMRDMQMLSAVDGMQFDRAYMDAQVTAHRYTLENLDRMIQQGGVSAEVLGVLQTTRASVAAHLEMAQEIRARL